MVLNAVSCGRPVRSFVIVACGKAALKALLVTFLVIVRGLRTADCRENFRLYSVTKEVKAEGETVEDRQPAHEKHVDAAL